MSTTENLTKAAHDAAFLRESLLAAQNGASAVESIILHQLIALAADLENRIRQYRSARTFDEAAT